MMDLDGGAEMRLLRLRALQGLQPTTPDAGLNMVPPQGAPPMLALPNVGLQAPPGSAVVAHPMPQAGGSPRAQALAAMSRRRRRPVTGGSPFGRTFQDR